MTIELQSDFTDYYDHWFNNGRNNGSRRFSRISNNGLTRVEMLEHLRSIGFTTPTFGKVKDIVKNMQCMLPKNENLAEVDRYLKGAGEVIVYPEPHLQNEVDSIKMPLHGAIKQYPNNLAVEFIDSLQERAFTRRFFCIGSRRFWLQITRENSWNATRGKVQRQIVREEFRKTPERMFDPFSSPLFTIDFVPGNTMYAISYNTAPKIDGTGIESLMSGHEVYREISNWLAKKPTHQETGHFSVVH